MYYAVVVHMQGITCNRYIGPSYNKAITVASKYYKRYSCQVYIEQWEHGICVHSYRFILATKEG